jgi:hypothetical protein
MASIAFLIEFKITCCNCAGSAFTEGGSASNSVTTDISVKLQFMLQQSQHLPRDILDAYFRGLICCLLEQPTNARDCRVHP